MTVFDPGPPTPAVPRSRRRARRLVALAAAALVGLGAAACTPEVNRTYDLINQSRANNGRPGYAIDTTLYFKAQGWADHLSRQGYLSHSNLADGAPAGWRALGENVGVAGSVDGVHNAFMNSSGHRNNILSTTFNRMGAGVTRDGAGRYWVVHEFAQL
jgi:uncharacterized protein YkwD